MNAKPHFAVLFSRKIHEYKIGLTALILMESRFDKTTFCYAKWFLFYSGLVIGGYGLTALILEELLNNKTAFCYAKWFFVLFALMKAGLSTVS